MTTINVESMFKFNYTFWLNLAFAALAMWLWNVNRRNPMEHGYHHDMDHVELV